MELDAENRTSFGKRPRVKKGYYPGQLVKVEVFSDKDGNPKIGKFGKQLIFEFAVYKADPVTDAPIAPMTYKARETDTEESPVLIPKFVYYQYKKTEKGKEWVEGNYQTAITPGSAITNVLEALGWKFSPTSVNPESFIGNFVELNLDDYKVGEGEESYISSSIKDIGPYNGPEIENPEIVKPSEKQKDVKKQVTHEAVKETEDENPEIKKIRNQIEGLKELNEKGLLTDEGLAKSIESMEKQIKGLEKK